MKKFESMMAAAALNSATTFLRSMAYARNWRVSVNRTADTGRYINFVLSTLAMACVSLLWLYLRAPLNDFRFVTPASAETNLTMSVREQMEAALFPACMDRQDKDPASQKWCRCFARSGASAIKPEQLELALKEGIAKGLASFQPGQFADVPRTCGNPPRQFTTAPKKTLEEYRAETYKLIYSQCIARIKHAGGEMRQAYSYCDCRAKISADEMRPEHANEGGEVLAELGRRVETRVKKECPAIR